MWWLPELLDGEELVCEKSEDDRDVVEDDSDDDEYDDCESTDDSGVDEDADDDVESDDVGVDDGEMGVEEEDSDDDDVNEADPESSALQCVRSATMMRSSIAGAVRCSRMVKSDRSGTVGKKRNCLEQQMNSFRMVVKRFLKSNLEHEEKNKITFHTQTILTLLLYRTYSGLPRRHRYGKTRKKQTLVEIWIYPF